MSTGTARRPIARRKRVSVGMSGVLAVVFATLLSGVLAGPKLLGFEHNVAPGEKTAVSLRVPHAQADDSPLLADRGQVVDEALATRLAARNQQLPPSHLLLLVMFACMFVVIFFLSLQVATTHHGRLLRTQIAMYAWVVITVAGMQAALLFSGISLIAFPVGLLTLLAALTIETSAALALGAIASLAAAWLVPFDTKALVVLLIQGITPPLLLAGMRLRNKYTIALSGLAGGCLAALAFVGLAYIEGRPATFDTWNAPLVACLAAGIITAIGALALLPMFQVSLGEVTRAKLVELEDLSNPLLQQIAQRAPGTWQHSLAMANMAEICANAIGADGRLVRVGAYYHDLGKSYQPKYFIENKQDGQASAHDALTPQQSCEAIFAHVTEGIRGGRDAGLPERIIDFMHMHHGNGLLEFFWHRCQEKGNPNELSEADFRYPGVPPQSKETAILAIVDAVEAASRTLVSPDETSIKSLVQRIVYGKLDLGQLDESGLTMSDLRMISESLCNTIKHAHHGRIRYPWQEKEDAEKAKSSAKEDTDDAQQTDDLSGKIGLAQTQVVAPAPLDSLDKPLPKKGPAWGDAIKSALDEEGTRTPTNNDARDIGHHTTAVSTTANGRSGLSNGQSVAGPPPDTKVLDEEEPTQVATKAEAESG